MGIQGIGNRVIGVGRLNGQQICVYSGIEFSGACPNLDCWANVESEGNPSRCLHHALGGKVAVGVADIALVTGESLFTVKQKVTRGKELIGNVLVMLDKFDMMRTDLYGKVKHCGKCGVLNEHGRDCLNTEKCSERRGIVEKILSVPPFCAVKPSVRPYELWAFFELDGMRDIVADTVDLGHNLKTRLLEATCRVGSATGSTRP